MLSIERPRRINRLTIAAVLLVMMAACSDSASTSQSGSQLTDTPDAGLNEQPDSATASELLPPPPEGQGIQLTMTTTIEAGVETEHCKFVTSPAEGIYVNRDEVRFTQGSHHFLLYLTPYSTIPTQNSEGGSVDPSAVFDCAEGPSANWTITKLIGGSQNAAGDSVIDFPPNVGMYIAPNSVLLMNAHYINATTQTLEPLVQVNLHTIPKADVAHEGDMMFWYNMFINVPGGSESRARMRCPIDADITITNVQSHMHARGVGYAAALMTGDTLEAPFYENTSWESVPVKRFDNGLKVAKGTSVDFYCDYKNTGDKPVAQGPTTKDEMCMLIASYYPAKPHISLCSGNPDAPQETQYLGAVWVGSGTATCIESMGCIQVALSQDQPAGFNFVTEVAKCLIASDPSVAKPFSAGVGCMFMSMFAGQDPMASCAEEIAACSTQ